MKDFTIEVAFYYILIIFVLIPACIIFYDVLRLIPKLLRKIAKSIKKLLIYIWEEIQKAH